MATINSKEQEFSQKISEHRELLNAHVVEMVNWHFSPETGCPFWLDWVRNVDWDPKVEIKGFKDLEKFGNFQDEWLRGGPMSRWVPK